MEPHSYVRISVAALALRVPLHARIGGGGQVHSASIPAYAELSLGKLPAHTAPVPLLPPGIAAPDSNSSAIAATFYLDERNLASLMRAKSSALIITLKMASQPSCCGRGSGVVLGTFELPVDRDWEASEQHIAHAGWVSIGKKAKKGSAEAGMELHAVVNVEPDPRLMFEFDGATTRSPQILQVHGDDQQPLFSIKFCTDRSSRPSLGSSDTQSRTGWDTLRASVPFGLGGPHSRERKGWLAMIHDLNGTPVAAASMVTPFVPSAGSDAVSKSNPGAWLLLRPEVDQQGNDTWRSWGKLEAWKERKGSNVVLRLSVVDGDGSSMPASQVVVAEATINPSKGGTFRIQGKPKGSLRMPVLYPAENTGKPSPAITLSQAWLSPQTGFVMSANIRGDRNKSCPSVNVSMRQVATVGDAAMFMALAAAVDLSIEACLPFRGSG